MCKKNNRLIKKRLSLFVLFKIVSLPQRDFKLNIMIATILAGLISSGAILLGALLGLYLKIGHKTIAAIMAFGTGVLISALSIDLMNEGFEQSQEPFMMGLSFFAGAFVFVLGDYFIDNNGGKFRKSSHGMEQNLKRDNPEESSGGAIFLGTLLDGIPESFVVGASIAAGGASGFVFIVAVFLSNLPEGMSGTVSMKMSGMSTRKVIFLWLATLVVTVLSTIGGYLFLGDASPVVKASMMAFASGAILAMLCDTMIPEAFKFDGRFVALITVAGFLLAFILSKV
jgi:ZIP family zinc transporter